MTSIKATLDTMLKRSLSLHGYAWQEIDVNGTPTLVKMGKDEAVREFMTALMNDSTTEREAAEKIIAAWEDGSGKLQKSLNAVRVEAVNNFIATESHFKSGFFSTVTLQPDEEPFYTNETNNETRIGSMGEDGTPEQVRIVKSQGRTPIGLYAVASDKVRYKTMDIYKGDVSQPILKTLDIGRDLTFKLDRIHYNLLTATVANGGCYGAFTTEQSRSNKATRIYLPHSSIVTAHLPTTNDIQNGSGTGGLTGADGRFTVRYYDAPSTSATGFRPAVLMAVQDYANSWANVLPASAGRLIPTGEIIVPASDIINIYRGAVITNDKQESIIQKEIQENGYTTLSIAGQTWKFVADLTITSGACFPKFNLVPGLSYEKPSFDREFVERNDVENWEQRFQRKAYGLCIPAQYRPRGCRVTYQ